MDYKENIKNNLKKYRQMAGISQTQLADSLGVSKAAVSNWEKGTNGIDTDTLFRIAEILHVSVSELGGVNVDYSLLNPKIKELIAVFETLPSHNQEDVLMYAKFLSEKKLVEYAKILNQLREQHENLNKENENEKDN